jgi:polyhydroxyalkanoic acid synthase PhaR subunit
MQNETTSRNPLSLLDFWQQWYETATRMWINALSGNQAAGSEPSDVYRLWANPTGPLQEQQAKYIQALFNPYEAWKLWLDTTMDIWHEAGCPSSDPLQMIRTWIKIMENMQAKIRSGEPLSIDPFTLFNEWYTMIRKPWSKATEDIIGSEQFLEFSGPFLESYSNLISAFRRASEAYFKTLRLPTLSDLAHVAELIVSLEEKVDHIEDVIEQLQGPAASQASSAPSSTIPPALEQRLHQLEDKLDRTLALLEQITARSLQSS